METFKLVLTFGVLIALAVVGIKVIPPCYANYEFEDAIKNDALQATYTSRSVDDIRTTVIKHAQEYDIALTPQQVHVTRNGGIGTGVLEIDAQYTVPLEFPGYTTSIDFHPSTSNKGVF
ncbi:MAG: hypothetical protein ACRD3Q_00655 [Terriglobales bacterium]